MTDSNENFNFIHEKHRKNFREIKISGSVLNRRLLEAEEFLHDFFPNSERSFVCRERKLR